MNAIVYALPVPHAAEHIETEAQVIPLPVRTKRGLQQTLPYEWPITDGANALTYVAPRVATGAADDFDVQPTPRADLPSARQWSMRLVDAMVEVINGVRPASQLTRWVTPELMTQVHMHMANRKTPRLMVRSIHVHETDDGVAEISAVFGTPARSFALAMRLEGLDGRWKATSLIWGM